MTVAEMGSDGLAPKPNTVVMSGVIEIPAAGTFIHVLKNATEIDVSRFTGKIETGDVTFQVQWEPLGGGSPNVFVAATTLDNTDGITDETVVPSTTIPVGAMISIFIAAATGSPTNFNYEIVGVDTPSVT